MPEDSKEAYILCGILVDQWIHSRNNLCISWRTVKISQFAIDSHSSIICFSLTHKVMYVKHILDTSTWDYADFQFEHDFWHLIMCMYFYKWTLGDFKSENVDCMYMIYQLYIQNVFIFYMWCFIMLHFVLWYTQIYISALYQN